MQATPTRRRFMTTVAMAGAASLLRAPRAPAAEMGSKRPRSVC
jgi:hypothetical protein